MTIAVGDKIPAGLQLTQATEGGPKPVQTDDLFSGKTVVLFAVPGAFTPSCSAQHLPGFVQHADAIKAKGVDAIACVSVNDAFVMGAWGKASGVNDQIVMLADGNGDFVKALDLVIDASGFGMGTRANRFSMVVKDGVVEKLNVESNPSAVDASSAETILGQL